MTTIAETILEYRCGLNGWTTPYGWSDWSDIDATVDVLATRGKGMVDTARDRRHFHRELESLGPGSQKWVYSLGHYEYGTAAGKSVVEGWIECRAAS